jgi:hypothetical protein
MPLDVVSYCILLASRPEPDQQEREFSIIPPIEGMRKDRMIHYELTSPTAIRYLENQGLI